MMEKFTNLFLTLFVLWTFEPGVTDTLEFQEYIGGPWTAVARPYFFTPDGGEYKVQIIPLFPQGIFRVSRVWTPKS